MTRSDTQTVVALPVAAADRRARELAALWAEQDRLNRQLRDVLARIVPLQRAVSRDRGYLFTVSREALERPARGQG